MYNTNKSFPSNGCDYNNKKLHNLSNLTPPKQNPNELFSTFNDAEDTAIQLTDTNYLKAKDKDVIIPPQSSSTQLLDDAKDARIQDEADIPKDTPNIKEEDRH